MCLLDVLAQLIARWLAGDGGLVLLHERLRRYDTVAGRRGLQLVLCCCQVMFRSLACERVAFFASSRFYASIFWELAVAASIPMRGLTH